MIGGPKFLFNLFSLFPKESYVVLTAGNAIDPTTAVAGSWLPGKYVFFDRKDGGPLPGDASSVGMGSRIPFRTRVSLLIQRIPFLGEGLLDALYLVLNLPNVLRSARKVIREEGITHLLGISDTGLALFGTYLAHRWTGIPYSVYLFDLYRGNRLTLLTRAIANFLEPRLIRGAQTVIVTNDATGEYLLRRYGKTFSLEIVYNSAFPEDFENLRTSPPKDPPYKILFTGNVYWAQERSVMNMIRAMDLLRDLPVELDLYCPSCPESIRSAARARRNVRLTSAPQAEMPRVQCEASLLFLPLAWGTSAHDIIATASPGKLTDYLASGRPMLVHAPEDSFVARYSREHQVGIVVDRDDVEELAAAVRKFFRDPASGTRYIENALHLFETRHDARRNARHLWKILMEPAEERSGIRRSAVRRSR